MINLKLGYIGIESSKRQEWEKLAEVLGLGVSDESDGKTLLLRMDDRHHRIAIHDGPSDALQYVGWDAGSEATLDELVSRLKKHGAAVEEGSAELCRQRWVQQLYRFTDPNGFRMELFFNPQVRSGPFRTASPMQGNFVTRDEGFGHLVFNCPDMKASCAFYMDVLGFRKTDSVRPQPAMDFLRCNSRHHSLAFMELPIKAGFQHLMLQLDELDDLGRCLDRAEKMGVPIVCTLGRHNVEQMLSFYLKAPSGFMVEVGWGAISVRDEASWSAKTYDPGSLWGHKWLERPG
jgi:2,3-dihydroxybiphenyl 1,2-dioxygenase